MREGERERKQRKRDLKQNERKKLDTASVNGEAKMVEGRKDEGEKKN